MRVIQRVNLPLAVTFGILVSPPLNLDAQPVVLPIGELVNVETNYKVEGVSNTKRGHRLAILTFLATRNLRNVETPSLALMDESGTTYPSRGILMLGALTNPDTGGKGIAYTAPAGSDLRFLIEVPAEREEFILIVNGRQYAKVETSPFSATRRFKKVRLLNPRASEVDDDIDPPSSNDEPLRTWSSRTGDHREVARYVGTIDDKAYLLRRDGHQITADIGLLSDWDQNYLRARSRNAQLVTFNNQSDDEVLVNVVGTIDVKCSIAPRKAKSIALLEGEFIIATRFGVDGAYTYSDAGAFTLEGTPTAAITVHEIGTSNLKPISRSEYEAILRRPPEADRIPQDSDAHEDVKAPQIREIE